MKNNYNTILGVISYASAMSLFLQLKTFNFIGFLLIIILIITGTELLSKFWINFYNLLHGLSIFMGSIISDILTKSNKE